MTEPLSPAAQAVAWAYDNTPTKPTGSYYWLAAALQAAADQVVPKITTPWNSTLTPMISAREVRAKFLAIAAELEGIDG